MKLYLVRHGEAVSKNVDPDCPLSARGRADVKRLAAHLAGRAERADRVLHSGKARARETAEILAGALAAGGTAAARTGLAPNDPVDRVADEVATWRDDVVLVGHLPFMGRLAARLVTGNEMAPLVYFDTANMLCLERDPAGAWAVVWMLTPETAASR